MAYRKAGYSKKFLAAHEGEITLHGATKKFFDAQGLTKLPTITLTYIASYKWDIAYILGGSCLKSINVHKNNAASSNVPSRLGISDDFA